MRVTRKAGKIYLDQTAYLEKVLQRVGMTNARTTPTPLPQGYKPLENTAQPDPAIRSRYQSVIGSLLYCI